MKVLSLLVVSLLLLPFHAFADEPITRQWKIGDDTREARIYAPDDAKTHTNPLLFVFHGHGGTIETASKKMPFYKHWPEAIVVYPQGLNTPGRLTDHEGKFPGWQAGPGEQDDRDLKFFDAILDSLSKDYQVDPKRVFVTGHSNGGSFTYVLWITRSNKIAAFAPSAAALSITAKMPDAEKVNEHSAEPRPVFHIAGENDPLVKFIWQERTIDHVRKVNQCEDDGQPWSEGCKLYPSKVGAPVITFIHPGKHVYPEKAQLQVVDFFKNVQTVSDKH